MMGFLLKKVRMEKDVKQINLAKGICSVSYLSKIENGQAIASEEILTLLTNRLELNIERFSGEKETIFMNSLYGVYKRALTERSNEELLDFTNKNRKQYEFDSLSNYFTFSLLMFRFSLMLNMNMELLENEMTYLETNEEKYETKDKYLYYVNKALYKYLISSYEESVFYIEKAKELLARIVLEPWETADFNYIICICYSKVFKFSQSIEYGQLSLDYYKDNLFLNRAIDCYIIMGNTQKNLSNYHEAKKHYNLALELTNLLRKNEYYGMIHHNMGLLYSSQGLLNKSIESFEKSLSYKDPSCINSYLLTKYTLIKAYHMSNNKEKTVELCQKGLSIIQQKGQNDLFKKYIMHFSIYISLSKDKDGIEEIFKNALDFFQSIQDNWNTAKYSIGLAKYYDENKQYKNANHYYRNYIDLQIKNELINSWEVL